MFAVSPITRAVGAEISGVYLNRLDGRAAAALRAALWRYQVLVFRDQHLDIAAQKRLTQAFGEPMRLPYVEPLADEPEVIAVLKEASERNVGVFGGDWHADFSFLDRPPAGSVLSAVEVPAVGGDTLWASQTAAYAALASELRRVVDGRGAIHVGKPYGVIRRCWRTRATAVKRCSSTRSTPRVLTA